MNVSNTSDNGTDAHDESAGNFRATYSPEDNKLRLYCGHVERGLYLRLKDSGFIRAHKQGCFVAPMWTPDREDLLMELCGDIGDEDTSLVERAEQRADRFGGYSAHRREDAERAQAAVADLTEHIPAGQPILVAHHDGARAQRDAEHIQSGMAQAVRLWETSQYWLARAKGALRHAKYKERPDVRVRRIRKVEADQRANQRIKDRAEKLLSLWLRVDDEKLVQRKDGAPTTLIERATYISGGDQTVRTFSLEDYPRNPPISQYEGQKSLYSALTDGIITPAQAAAIAIDEHRATISRQERWIAHHEHRLTYERVMLEEQGGSKLLTPKSRPQQLPLCNYRAPDGLNIPNPYRQGEILHYPQIDMTAAEYSKIYRDYKGTRIVDCSHRVRTAMRNSKLYCVFLTDAKVHTRPAAAAPPERAAPLAPKPRAIESESIQDESFRAMRESLHQGVQVAAVPQLFPTPAALARDIVRLASRGIGFAGKRVLEPSAGTGHLWKAIFNSAGGADCCTTVAVEIDRRLCGELEALRNRTLCANDRNHRIVCADFLSCGEELELFDAIVMNPPFANGQDVRHVTHALQFLKPDGRLVAVMSAGLTFRSDRATTTLRATLQARGATIEPLPAESFVESGTQVKTVLVMLDA